MPITGIGSYPATMEMNGARFYVRIAPEAMQQNLDTVLIVKSAAFADFELRVPLRVRVVEDAKKVGAATAAI